MKRKAAQLSPAASASASIVRSSAPSAVPPVATYGTDVLGKSCLVMFEMDDNDPSKLEPFRGTVTAFEATLKLQENLEAKMAAEETAAIKSEHRSQPSRRAASAALPKQKQKNDGKDEPRKPRTQKYRKNYNPDNWKPHVNRLHFITFDDGDERWLNLSELQAEGRLWWQDTASATTAKAEDTKPAATSAVPTMPPGMMPGMMMPNPMLAMQHQQWAVMQQQMHAQMMQRRQAAAGAASTTAPTTETDATTTPAKTTTQNRDSATPSTEEAQLGYNKDGSIKKRKGRKPGSKNRPKVGPDGQPIPKEAHVASKKTPRTPRTPDVPITSVPPSEPPPDTLLLGELKQGGEDPDLSWLEALRAWMMKVPHGRHAKTASKDNAGAVVRQHKLATGEGITQAHWAVPFYQHIVVDPRVTDPAKIMADAKEFEEVHGDKSGGWKLKHPIKNFVDFCEYIKDPVAAIAATAEKRATLDEAAAKRSATKASSKKKTKASPPSSTPQDGQTLEEFVEAMARKEGAGENTSVAAPGTPVAEVVTETEVLAMPEAEIVATATTSPTKPSPSTAGAAAAAAARKSSSHSKRKANRVAASYSQAYAHTQTQAAPSPITRQQPRSHSGSNDLFVADQAAAAVAQALYNNSRQQIPQHHHQQTLSDHYYGQHQQQPAIDRALQNVALQSAAQQLHHHQQQQQRQQQQQQQQNNLFYGRQHQNNYHASL